MGRSRLIVFDRIKKTFFEEKVYGGSILRFMYRNPIGWPLAWLLSSFHFFSKIYGWWQKQPFTKRKVVRFIRNYGIDSEEFLDSPDSFSSFNDFFVRKLKPAFRPIAKGKEVAIIPADGRYMFYPGLSQTKGFYVKGEKFDLSEFLENNILASRYEHGSMVIARLCPVDYHRFHFPCDCVPAQPHLINGYLYSVNPIAIKRNIHIFSKNKRVLTSLHSELFGEVLYVEVGATNVGSIVQTYPPGKKCEKGEEKGYFEFGGSTIVILFLPGSIQFDQDLVEISAKGFEVKCLMGQSMGRFLE